MENIIQFDGSIPLIRQKMTIEDGFENEEAALKFGNNACGAACLKMVLEAFGIPNVPSVKELALQGTSKSFYKESCGWIHKGLVAMGKSYGLSGYNKNILNKPEELVEILQNRCLIIASVSLGFQPLKRGGHLVVITGLEESDNNIQRIFFRDPSLWGQTNSSIPAQRFFESTSGNIIVFSKP
jgi:hypothetical protein